MRKEAIVGTEYERNERPADSTVAPHSARRYPATQGRANVREGLAMDEDDPRFKRQSLYTPPPGRDTKRSKSEESMRQHNLDEELLQDSPSKQIGDVLHDLKDMTDDFNQQQAQVRFLIWQCAERQRQEASTKISIKNWWKYELQDSRDYFEMILGIIVASSSSTSFQGFWPKWWMAAYNVFLSRGTCCPINNMVFVSTGLLSGPSCWSASLRKHSGPTHRQTITLCCCSSIFVKHIRESHDPWRGNSLIVLECHPC